jgi:vitamin B12 transporter
VLALKRSTTFRLSTLMTFIPPSGGVARTILFAVLNTALAAQVSDLSKTEPTSRGQAEAPSKSSPLPVTTITVTAEPLPVSVAPASVSVMTEEEIEQTHALTSADLMRNTPFVNLSQNGAAGALSTVTIRGGKPNLVLVMIDGMPVNDLSNLLGGSFDFSNLLSNDLERIEVVRGPLSSGYGSEAMSGVVNVITKPTHYESNITVGLEAGSFGAAGANTKMEGAQGRLGYKFSGSFLRVGEQIESDAFSTGSIAATGDFARSADTVFSWMARWIQFERSGLPEGSGGPEFAILRIPKTTNSGNWLGGFVAQHQVNQLWSTSVDADVFSRGEHADTPAILDSLPRSSASEPSADTRTRFTRLRLTIQNTLNFGPKVQGHLSFQGADEIGKNDTILAGTYPTHFDHNRGIFNFSGDAVYSGGNITAMGAIGVNKTLGFNAQLAPRLGASLKIAKNTIVKASWGQAYKVPSFYSVGDPVVGNPSLLPEKVSGLDAGVRRSFREKLILAATYYHNHFSDLIDFSSQEFKLVNRSSVRTQGLESSATYRFARYLQVNAWGTLLDWTVESSTEPLRDQPDWQAGLNLDWKLPKQFMASSSTYWTGRRYDFQIPVPLITSVGGYSTTNLVLGYDGLRHTSLFVRINNVFNARFHEYIGFPNPGIAMQAGISYRIR